MHKVQPSVYRKGIQPSILSRLINASTPFNFFRVGLKSHIVFKHASDVAKGEASDWMEHGSSRVNRVYTRTTDRDQRQVRLKLDYKGRD